MNNNLYNYINTNHPLEYVEDYLRKNIGKNIEVYTSFPDSIEWRDSIFKGILEQVGKDYIVVNNQIIWCIYINYILIK